MFSVGERFSRLLLSRSNHPSSLVELSKFPCPAIPTYVPEFFWLSRPGIFRSDPDLFWWRAREGLLKGMSMTLSDWVDSCRIAASLGGLA